MLVSHSKRFIYFKTRKTAGTSVELALERYARPEGWSPPQGDPFPTPQSITDAGIVGARGPANKHNARWIDHTAAGVARRHLPRRVWNEYFRFCVVRNPWDKTISAFFHANNNAREFRTKKTIRAFRRWLFTSPTVRGEDFTIYAIGGRPVMDDYIFYHELQEDLGRIATRLDIVPDGLGAYHGAFRPTGPHYTTYYDEETRKYVGECYAKAIEHFGWTFDNTGPLRRPPPPRRRAWLNVLSARLPFLTEPAKQ